MDDERDAAPVSSEDLLQLRAVADIGVEMAISLRMIAEQALAHPGNGGSRAKERAPEIVVDACDIVAERRVVRHALRTHEPARTSYDDRRHPVHYLSSRRQRWRQACCWAVRRVR